MAEIRGELDLAEIFELEELLVNFYITLSFRKVVFSYDIQNCSRN